MEIGVQSYCFRKVTDTQELAQKVRQIGCNRIELCGVHADFHNLRNVKEVVRILHDRGISIDSIGVQTFKGADNERDWFECAREAGARHISAHFEAATHRDAIPKVQTLCDEFDMKVGLHCHGGWSFTGPKPNLEYLVSLGAPQIGVCIDTAWAQQTGPRFGDPITWIRDFGPAVTGMHLKDFVYDRNGQWNDVVIGTGNLDLPGVLKALHEIPHGEAGQPDAQTGYTGWTVIEYEADVDDPTPALKECVKKAKAALATIQDKITTG